MNSTNKTGTKLWQKAKKIIPGGNQFLSKRAEMFLPDHWPAYYKKAKGITVWDLDGNKYLDFSIMGIGACTLGYANPQVNKAVKKAIDQGSASTFNAYEEVQLAQTLIKLHPPMQQARFTRSGGEACALAIRIARAASKKDIIAFCGYHGWHDWYLAANLTNRKNLDGQLLPGLDPAGVPRVLKKTALPFHYGKINQLKKIISQNKKNLGVIIMEVKRHHLDLKFLRQVQKLAKDHKLVLIFDETSSGFRSAVGGMYTLYHLKPDMVILGKALGNGFPIAAVLGRRRIMQSAQDSFISSSFWSERIGYVAALKTISQFQKLKVIKHTTAIGKYLSKGLSKIFTSHKLNITVTGLESVPVMKIAEPNPMAIKTIFTQEMLKRHFLASTVIYISYAHKKELVNKYLHHANQVFRTIAQAKKNKTLKKLLEGPVCHQGFKRLT